MSNNEEPDPRRCSGGAGRGRHLLGKITVPCACEIIFRGGFGSFLIKQYIGSPMICNKVKLSTLKKNKETYGSEVTLHLSENV